MVSVGEYQWYIYHDTYLNTKKSIKYQVSWYIFGTVSVSVSLIHFRCISIIIIDTLLWYIYWNYSELFIDKICNLWTLHPECSQLWVELRISQILAMLPTDISWSWKRFLWLCTAQYHQLTLSTGNLSTTWVTLTLNWKCWQDAVESTKFSLNSTQLHQLKDCSTRLDRCHAGTIWVTVSMFEKLLLLKKTTVYFRTEGFCWHYYLCFYLMALILQFTFWCKLYARLFVLLCCIFGVFNVSLASTLGLAEDFQKYQQSIKNHDTFKMYQYHDTI